MTNEPTDRRIETPRLEPEIIPPPRRGGDGFDGYAASWDGARVRVIRIGPWRLALWIVSAIAFAAVVLFLFAGALLIAVPIIAILAFGSLAAARLRGWFGR